MREPSRQAGNRHGRKQVGANASHTAPQTSVQIVERMADVFQPVFDALAKADDGDAEALSALGSISLPSDAELRRAMRRLPTHEVLAEEFKLDAQALTQDRRGGQDRVQRGAGDRLA